MLRRLGTRIRIIAGSLSIAIAVSVGGVGSALNAIFGNIAGLF